MKLVNIYPEEILDTVALRIANKEDKIAYKKLLNRLDQLTRISMTSVNFPLKLQHPFIKSSDCKKYQMRLKELGFNLVADGVYGPATELVVKEFQKRAGLKPTGVLDDSTHFRLHPEDLVEDDGSIASDIGMVALQQVGKPYIYGYEVDLRDLSPACFDCSELIEWLFHPYRTLLKKPVPDGAANQYDYTKAYVGPKLPRNALGFLGKKKPLHVTHVGIFLGSIADGSEVVVEAKGKNYGVIRTTRTEWEAKPSFLGWRTIPGWNPDKGNDW